MPEKVNIAGLRQTASAIFYLRIGQPSRHPRRVVAGAKLQVRQCEAGAGEAETTGSHRSDSTRAGAGGLRHQAGQRTRGRKL